MLRKPFLIIGFLAIVVLASAQNLQLHFDPRRALHSDTFDKNYFTATFEMFKPDKWGSTFMFVDLDFNQSRGNIGTAYLEIARDMKLGSLPFMAHVEFNGGVGKVNDSGFSIPNAYLAGASYSRQVGGVNLSTYLVYKYNAFEKVSNDFQWTVTWGTNLLNDKVTLCGFFDLWSENKNQSKAPGEKGKKLVVLTEPQFWYNVNSNFSLGSEIEISNNFVKHSNKALVNPTIAAKWNF